MNELRVLVACEFSGTVRRAFAAKGHDAWSCDLGGRHKPLFMHANGDVLIDDFEKNTQAWQAAGGVAILHRSFEETAAAIRALAEEVRK